MKICFITTQYDEFRGGNDVFAELFKKIGDSHEITVLTSKVAAENFKGRAEIVKIKSRSHLYSYNDYIFSRGAVRRLSELLKREKFDLLLVNQVISSPILKLKRFNIPVIYIIHHPVSVDIDLALSESRGLVSLAVWRIRYGRMRPVQKKLVHEFKNVLTVSHAARNRIISDYHAPADKIKVIYNGVDTDFYRKTKPTVPKTVLALGSYQHPRRGFPFLLSAYKTLSQKGFRIMDVGRRKKEQLVQLKGVSGVEILSVVEKSKLPDLFSQASVFVSTSLFEGFGLAIAQSLACETPVAAFAGGAVEEILYPVNPDFICEPRNVAELVKKVERYDRERDSLGLENCRNYILERFGLEKMASEYSDYFKSIVSRHETESF
jgi:glycosyltransferase involved in cell wall biosynthesis